MKTLLQINSVINWGSTGKIAEEIGEIAISNGYRSIIAFGRNQRPSRSELIKIGSRLDMEMHGICTRLFDMHGLGSISATRDLIKKIKDISPSIIHLHNIHGYYLNIQILFNYLQSVKIPVIWTLHDCWALTGHCAYFDLVRCERWKNYCHHCPQKKEYPKSFFFDRSEENYKDKKKLFRSVKRMILVSVSSWMSNLLKDSFLNNYENVIIPNGIDTNLFSKVFATDIREKYGIGEKFMILGVSSIWSKRKGLHDLIELSKIIPQNHTIVVVGLDKDQMKEIPSGIIGITRTENINELVSLYSAADVFVNPTWEDNFPTTNIESLSCGTPILTYNTGGCVEAVSSETGLIVEKGDINGLKQALVKIEMLGKDSYSNSCRERALSHFDKQACFNKYIELYNSLT